MPGILTLALPVTHPAFRLARRMERCGYLLAHRSNYLADRIWVQICLMGRWDPHALEVLPEVMATQLQARSAPGEEEHPATEYVAAA